MNHATNEIQAEVDRLQGLLAVASVQPGTRWRWKQGKYRPIVQIRKRHPDGLVDLIFLTGPCAARIDTREWTAAKIAEVAELLEHGQDVEETMAEWKAVGAAEERKRLLSTPEFRSFADGVVLEAQHQRQRWGKEHDEGKADADWFWLIGWLAGKAVHNPLQPGEDATEKRLHRIITAAAALANWHAQILGQSNMRPGIEPPEPLIRTGSEAGEKYKSAEQGGSR